MPTPALSPEEQQGILHWLAVALGTGILALLGLGAKKAGPVLVDAAVEASVRRKFATELEKGIATAGAVERIEQRTLELGLKQDAMAETVSEIRQSVGEMNKFMLRFARALGHIEAASADGVHTDYSLPAPAERDGVRP